MRERGILTGNQLDFRVTLIRRCQLSRLCRDTAIIISTDINMTANGKGTATAAVESLARGTRPATPDQLQIQEQGEQEIKDQQHELRILYTVLIYLTYLCNGLGYITSSTLLDVADQTHSTTLLVSIGFSVKTLVYCSGSVFFAWLLDRVNRQTGIMLALTGLSVSIFCVPLCPTVQLYWLTQAMTGFSNAGLDICCLSWLLEMWPSHSVNSYMQGLYLCLNVGNMMSASIAAPFLSRVGPAETDHEPVIVESAVASASSSNSSDVLPLEALQQTQIIIPYSMISAFCVAVVVGHGAALYAKPYIKNQKVMSRSVSPSEADMVAIAVPAPEPTADAEASGARRRKVAEIVVLGSLLLGLLEGAAYSNSSYLPAFAVFCDLHLSKQVGAFMYSQVTGTAALTLLISAWAATKISSRMMLYLGSGFFLSGNLLLFYAASHSLYAMFAAVSLLGIGYSIFAPNAYSFLSSQLSLSNQIFGCFTFTKSIGRSLASYVTGIFIEDQPAALMFTNLFCLFFAVAIILVFQFKIMKPAGSP